MSSVALYLSLCPIADNHLFTHLPHGVLYLNEFYSDYDHVDQKH